ncbi:permease prefix domain 1-containing protein [Paenibacillus phocaensis]|uniref:permease prefix domain 1-containing protein n=1 Tax=Paenibacillus phocaensis TaxID=1776378 RepID=UPI00039D36E8|nr:permease prefix domain 1-containing protein [Paenibacillus phocaensis]
MNPLQKHVDRLFAGYPATGRIRELKEEILGNLEAKTADYMAGGMNYEQAVQAATASLTRIDGLIDENPQIYVNRYRLELLQKVLLFTLILWIFTIPLRMIERTPLSYLFLALVLLLGCLYLILNALWRGRALEVTAPRNIPIARRRSRLVWLLWGLFIVITVLGITALRFSSNIWFGYQVKIGGPYQFAVLGIQYAKPLLTILIPLAFQASATLISKHEAGEPE